MLDLDTLDYRLSLIDGDFYNVNAGGCCVVAAHLAAHLEAYVNDLQIRTCGYKCDPESLDDVRERLYDMYGEDTHFDSNDWDRMGVEFYHVWVEFEYDGQCYAADSTGLRSPEEQADNWASPTPGSFTIEEALDMAGTRNGWNRMFDRAQIPSIIDYIVEAVELAHADALQEVAA